MIHHSSYFCLKPQVTPEQLEGLLINTRIHLLKIPEVMNLKTGKNVNAKSKWQFFLSFDCESLAKLAGVKSHPVNIKFLRDSIEPNTAEVVSEDFEMEPGKDVRYS